METIKSNTLRLTRAFAAAGRLMLNHEVPRDAAAISYFSLVALFPAILVLIALIDAFLGWMELHKLVVQCIISLFPGSRQFLRTNLNELTAPSTAVVLSCVAVVLWSSTWIFTFIESALNRAWGVSRRRTFWESRLRSVALMVLGGACLLISVCITATISAERARAVAQMPDSATLFLISWFWYVILLSAGFLIAVLVFSLTFKLMPDRKVAWTEAFSGALVSTILWEVGSYLFAKLVPYFDYQKIYGRMGAVVALLVWIYTMNLIMLFGANFSAQLHKPPLEKLVLNQQTFPRDKIRSFRSLR